MKKKLLITLLILTAHSLMAQWQFPASAVDSLVRPNNATQYTAGDVLNDSLTATKVLVFNFVGPTGGAARAGQTLTITQAVALSDTGNWGVLRLHLFTDSTNIPRTADNAAFTPLYTNGRALRYAGYITLTTFASAAAAGGGFSVTASGAATLPFPIQLSSTSSQIYGIVEVTGTPTPKRLSQFFFTLKGYVQ